MFGFAFITSEASLVSVSLKSFVTFSVPLTKAWLVDGEVCNITYKTMKLHTMVVKCACMANLTDMYA